MHAALQEIARATEGTPFQGDLWLVGGAVRDELLGKPTKNDFDIVTRGSSLELCRLLRSVGVASRPPVTYERFGTAMAFVAGAKIEIATARRESYEPLSRKPAVEPATLEEDARRRDFTVNALLRNLHSLELSDPLGIGMSDLESRILRTPLDPAATFHDDPLRILRAVRFRWQLNFEPAPGLYQAIESERARLAIISAERIRGEIVRMLELPNASSALRDLMRLGLFEIIAPELVSMVGVEQGSFHHLDVWEHTLKVLDNVGPEDLALALGALLHDVGKPGTRTKDAQGHTRFFGHEAVGAEIAREILRRLRFPQRDVDVVVLLVKNHMRLGSAPQFTLSAARRLLRDLGDEVERLLRLVEADSMALKAGVRRFDLAPIRARIEQVQKQTPRSSLTSPLSGEEIMETLNLASGPEVGRWKAFLTEKVLDGELLPGDRDHARRLLVEKREAGPNHDRPR